MLALSAATPRAAFLSSRTISRLRYFDMMERLLRRRRYAGCLFRLRYYFFAADFSSAAASFCLSLYAMPRLRFFFTSRYASSIKWLQPSMLTNSTPILRQMLMALSPPSFADAISRLMLLLCCRRHYVSGGALTPPYAAVSSPPPTFRYVDARCFDFWRLIYCRRFYC